MQKGLFRMLVLSLCFCSCHILHDTPKNSFADGYYSSKVLALPSKKVYVNNEEEVVQVYPLKKRGSSYYIDTIEHRPLTFTPNNFDSLFKKLSFTQASFDIDFLTIPFKYRASQHRFPRQFNSTLNGAVYLGYRSDVYLLHYKTNPLGSSKRQTTHYGFSFGAFSGFGGTAMNPWVTNDQITIEYDGVVWTTGMASIIALNNVTAGLAVGWDRLFDNNKRHWIYQKKPWFGFVFGLNLN
jgi:hypothetical protein